MNKAVPIYREEVLDDNMLWVDASLNRLVPAASPVEPGLGRGSDQPLPEINQAQARLLSNLQIELAVEAGKLELSVEDLLDLSPGRVIEYVLAEQPEVKLRMGSSVIAKGKFVSQEGQLCVEITSLEG